MQCPLCTVELNMINLKGIEVDDCPKCKGIWLDRGELDRLIGQPQTDPADPSAVVGWADPPSFTGGFHGYPHARRYGHKRNKTPAHEYVEL